jgi:hypothetical protein
MKEKCISIFLFFESAEMKLQEGNLGISDLGREKFVM